MTSEERFWNKVAKPKVDQSSECWYWTFGLTIDGYGTFWLEGKNIPAHRFAWSLVNGTIPRDLVIDHLCRNRRCVNIAHMRLVSSKENVLCGAGRSAQNANKTHCQNGHEFTPENTKRSKDGHRHCHICLIERKREYRKLNPPTPAEREQSRLRATRYYEQNRDEINAKRRQ